MEQCDQRNHVGTSYPFLIWWRSNPWWRNNRVTVRPRVKASTWWRRGSRGGRSINVRSKVASIMIIEIQVKENPVIH
jgi:hypothetical protein